LYEFSGVPDVDIASIIKAMMAIRALMMEVVTISEILVNP
jgi:hypothetical protein